MKKLWILYDERAILSSPDDAIILVACDSLREAWDFLRNTFGGGVIYEYDVNAFNELVQGEMVGWRSNGREWKI